MVALTLPNMSAWIGMIPTAPSLATESRRGRCGISSNGKTFRVDKTAYACAMHPISDDITAWIHDWQDGDAQARDRVFARLYLELKRLAAAVLRSESGHETLQPTALLNDALIKLTTAASAPAAEDRKHFARIVARAMRQILVDRARRKLAEKRGGGEVAESLDGLEVAVAGTPAELVALDDALATLARLDARAAAVVELRVFAGLTIDETAQALQISPSAVNREWAHASAWLKNDVFGAR
ncbi:ECF-type sigma factor [Tahibacter amnicola]|uniref:ECF-type sigma factor n=1 Tax=Tahibacter amnicola TaxID=2976241 RepID=A0ABY6BE32_9GAMM|nr:ECF-type sigma factor [Tahibacter amnicola]UXI68283.1 ECF-type sigma factor [Tahibacter amnicola]